MKKIITYISFLAALVIAASCINERISREESDGDGVITLRLQTSAMQTRADDAPTEEDIENAVTHADFFFFSDEAGTDLLYHTRLTVGEGGLTPKGTNTYEYTFDVSSEGNELQKTSYLYVIANYQETISATDGETTLDDLLGMDIKTDLSGKFSSFVMDSYHVDGEAEKYVYQLKPSKKADEGQFTIGLTRAAAKLVLNINVANSYTDDADNVWEPVTDQMWVNFINARKAGKVAATPVTFDQKANYFTTAQETPTSVTPAPSGFTTWKVGSVYTYPQSYETSDVTAPYFKIFCPWKCEKYNMANFYYKIILPELGSFKRNKIYNLTVNLSTIGGDQDDWALVSDYIYVADWWAPEAIEASFEGAMYLDVPVKYYEIYGVDYIDIPVVSSNDIQVINVTGTKTNLYNGNTVSVTPTISNVTKDGFRLTHVLNDDITSSGFDCTPITYTMTVRHTAGGLSKTVNVTVVQYPSIYAEADESNGYAYVNSYTYTTNRYNQNSGTARGGRWNYGSTASTYNINNYRALNNNNAVLGTMSDGSNSTNSNYNQYVVHISVLPQGYKVAGTSEDVVIGDPRGGSLTSDYLGYAAGTNGGRVNGVKAAYDAVSSSSQNVIAPALRIASSWGASTAVPNFDRAEERCAAYQENGYPAGRWRLPTLAEIDFLISLSNNNHIPALFTAVANNNATIYGAGNWGGNVNNATYYSGYWAGGEYLYVGTAYNSNKPFVLINDESGPYRAVTNSNTEVLRVNNEYFRTNIRCVYDEWYWSDQKYGNNGQPTTGNAATQWLGYIF